jgi:predicted porin
MKKTLVALAALAATSAFAQSSVQIDGNVDAGFRNRSSQAAADKFGKVQANNTSTTALFFRGTEDLGGGVKASFLAELDWNPTQSQTLDGTAGAQYYVGTPFNGEQFIGLESASLGKVRIGTPNSAILEANGQAQPFGTAVGGGYMNTGVNCLGAATVATLGVNQFIGGAEAAGRVIRYERAVRYDTPVFNGFSASYLYSAQNGNQTDTATKASDNTNGVNELGLKYSNGPLNVNYATTTIEAGNKAASSGPAITGTGTGTPTAATYAFTTATAGLAAGQSVKYTYAAANYKVGNVTVYGGLTTGKTGGGLTTMDTASKNIAVKYQVNGALALMANVLRVDDKLAANQDAKLVGAGADYALSKRTTAYYRFEQADSKVADTTAGKYVTQAIGLRHTF